MEEGNIEYKLKLVNPSDSRLEHLVTQMKWRLQEGQGEAIYEIGVEDNGLLTGLTHVELQSSIDTLHNMASRWAVCWPLCVKLKLCRHLGSGRIAASEMEAAKMLVNLVQLGCAAVQSETFVSR